MPTLFHNQASDIFSDMKEDYKREMIERMISTGVDLITLPEMRDSGQFLYYAGNSLIAEIFKDTPHHFFDGKLWNEPWESLEILTGMDMREAQCRATSMYSNCLDDLVLFMGVNAPEPNTTSKARLSLKILTHKLV